MATVNFYPRTKTGKSKIQARICIGRGKDFLLSTKVGVEDVSKDWDFENKRSTDSRVQKVLDILEAKFKGHIADVELDLSRSVSDIQSDDFRQIVYDVHKVPIRDRTLKQGEKSFLTTYVDQFLDRSERRGYRTRDNKHKSYTEATLVKYRQLRSSLELYQKEEESTLFLNSFDRKRIESFEDFLVDHYAVSTAGRKLKALKTVLSDAFDHGENVHPDFRQIKGFSYETTVVPLTDEEQELIYATPMPSKELEYAKDWLLILCGTGQRFIDCNRLTKEMVKDGRIHLTQQKTGAKVQIPLFDRVQRIIEKYDGFPPRFTENEKSQNARLNKLVKEVCRKCGINEILNESKNGKKGKYPKYQLISTKTGRKSLSTYLYKECGWVAQDCMAITGHKQLENFFVYVGGKNTAINERNMERAEEMNRKAVAKRTETLKKA